MLALFLKLGAIGARLGGLVAFPGAGLLGAFFEPILIFVKAALRQLKLAIDDTLKNPRVFIVIGLTIVIVNYFSWHRGFDQGKGDLNTYRREAKVYQQQADANAEAALVAGRLAEDAERKRIMAEAELEKAKTAKPAPAVSQRRKRADKTPDEKGSALFSLDWITGANK